MFSHTNNQIIFKETLAATSSNTIQQGNISKLLLSLCQTWGRRARQNAS